jgi:hypothetical protein
MDCFSRKMGLSNTYLKVLTNEKRGGLKVVAFDRSSFKLFTLRFSNKSVQAPSCERPRTAPRTLFLSFANNNCFQITVLRRSCMKKSVKLACHVVNSNIAIGSLPTLQIAMATDTETKRNDASIIGVFSVAKGTEPTYSRTWKDQNEANTINNIHCRI